MTACGRKKEAGSPEALILLVHTHVYMQFIVKLGVTRGDREATVQVEHMTSQGTGTRVDKDATRISFKIYGQKFIQNWHGKRTGRCTLRGKVVAKQGKLHCCGIDESIHSHTLP